MRVVPWILLCAVSFAPAYVQGQWADSAGSAGFARFDNNADIRALYEVGDTLWVGTNGGLVALDLLTDEVAGKVIAGPALTDNSVRTLAYDGHGLYVGTDYGLSVLRPGGDFVYEKIQSTVFSDVRSVSFNFLGDMYIGTFGHGVGVLDRGDGEGNIPLSHLSRITREDSLLDNKVFAVAPVDTGRVYFATSLGFCAYRDSAWVSFQAGAGLPRGEVRQLLHDKDDVFYLLIRGRGIYHFDDTRGRRIRVMNELPSTEVSTITLDSTGAVWAAGRFGRIARHQGGSWTALGTNLPEVLEAKWRCAHTGPSGSVYFGSADGLIAIVRNGDIRTVRLPSQLPSGFVGAMVEDARHHRFIVNGTQLLVCKDADGVPAPDTELGSVFALTRAADGAIWVSAPWGLLRREGDEWQEIRPAIEPRAPVFLSLAFDAGRNLWAGAHDGEVFRFDGQLWVPYAGHGELAAGPIFRIVVDSRQTVWAVTRDTGVYRFAGRDWEAFGEEVFGPGDIRDATIDGMGRAVVITDYAVWVYDMARGWATLPLPPVASGANRVVRFDEGNRLYLGTTEGLAVFAAEGGSWFGARDGLGGKEITALLIDSDATLWVGFRTDGISRIPLETLWRQALSLEER